MAGTFVTDANKTNLLAGGTYDPDNDAATETYGAALQVNAPGNVLFRLTPVDPDANNDATISVAIQGCETSDFTTGDVVHIASFDTLTEAAIVTAIAAGEDTYELGPIYVDTKYIRAAVSIVDGTDGDFDGTTLYMEAPFYQRGVHFLDSTSNPAQPSAGHKA